MHKVFISVHFSSEHEQGDIPISSVVFWLAACQSLGEGKARRSVDTGYGFSSSDARHPSPPKKAGLELKPSIHELEEASAPSLLVTESGSSSRFGFELDEARLPPPLKKAGLAVIADVASVLDEARLLPPTVAGLAAIAC